MKALRKINSGLLDQHEHNNYNIDKSQDSQSNSKADLYKMEDLNIS